MHQTRYQTSKKIPIVRKGTVYVARPMSHNNSSVTVVAAVRDMLKLARTAHEVKEMVKKKMLKVNGRVVRSLKENVKLFNVLEADKPYKLTLLSTGRFSFEETKDHSRIARVVGKKVLGKNIIQINFHDGTNGISKEAIKIGDSAEIGTDGKIKKILPLKEGHKVFVIAGRNIGAHGNVKKIGGSEITVDLGGRIVALKKDSLIVI